MKVTLGILFLIFFVSCGTTNLYVNRNIPSKVNFNKYKTIVIGRIRGDHDKQFSFNLIKSLSNSSKVIVLDRDNTDTILEEDILYKKSNKYLKNADLLLTGNLIEREEYLPPIGQGETEGRFDYISQADLKVTDLDTGELIYSKTFKQRSLDTDQRNEFGQKVRTTLFHVTRDRIIRDFMESFIESKETVTVKVFKNNDIPELIEGHRLVEEGQFHEAIKKYKMGLERNNLSSETKGHVLHGLAVALMFNNDFEEARKKVNQAYNFNSKNEYLQLLPVIKEYEAEFKSVNRN